jgi:hypothetical protein
LVGGGPSGFETNWGSSIFETRLRRRSLELLSSFLVVETNSSLQIEQLMLTNDK